MLGFDILVGELRILHEQLLDHFCLQLYIHVHSLRIDVETGSLLGGRTERIASLVTAIQKHHFLGFSLQSLHFFVFQSHGILARVQFFSHTLYLPVLAFEMLVSVVQMALEDANLFVSLGLSRRGGSLRPLVAVLSLLFEEVSFLFQFLNHVVLVEELVLKMLDLVLISELGMTTAIGGQLRGCPSIVPLQVLPVDEELELTNRDFGNFFERTAILADFWKDRSFLAGPLLREKGLQYLSLHLHCCLESLLKCVTRVRGASGISDLRFRRTRCSGRDQRWPSFDD